MPQVRIDLTVHNCEKEYGKATPSTQVLSPLPGKAEETQATRTVKEEREEKEMPLVGQEREERTER